MFMKLKSMKLKSMKLNTPKNYLYAKKTQQNASQTRSVEKPPHGEKNSANPAR